MGVRGCDGYVLLEQTVGMRLEGLLRDWKR